MNQKEDAAKIAAAKANIQPSEPAIATNSVEPVAAVPAPGTATLTPASVLEPET